MWALPPTHLASWGSLLAPPADKAPELRLALVPIGSTWGGAGSSEAFNCVPTATLPGEPRACHSKLAGSCEGAGLPGAQNLCPKLTQPGVWIQRT